MLDAAFLWCRDHKIYGSSRKEIERLVRSERQRFLETFLGRVEDRLVPETAALMEASLADPESPTGFHTIKGDAGAATLDNMLGLADRLAFIKKLELPRDLLTGAGKTWIDQIVRRVSELESARGPLGLPIERDLHFKPTMTIGAYGLNAVWDGRIKA